jgi:hypothetical protein
LIIIDNKNFYFGIWQRSGSDLFHKRNPPNGCVDYIRERGIEEGARRSSYMNKAQGGRARAAALGSQLFGLPTLQGLVHVVSFRWFSVCAV